MALKTVRLNWLKTYPCKTKEELLQREGHYIQTLECVNKTVVGRSKEEKKEIRKIKRREEYLANKNNEKEKAKEYYHNNREYILAKGQEKVECPICKSLFSRNYLPIHIQRKNHST